MEPIVTDKPLLKRTLPYKPNTRTYPVIRDKEEFERMMHIQREGYDMEKGF